MGIFSRNKNKKGRQYRSENAQDERDPEYSKVKDPYLVIGDAPPRPMFAGKGLESNTEYQYKRDSQDEVSGRSQVRSILFRKERKQPCCTEATSGTSMHSLICSLVRFERCYDGPKWLLKYYPSSPRHSSIGCTCKLKLDSGVRAYTHQHAEQNNAVIRDSFDMQTQPSGRMDTNLYHSSTTPSRLHRTLPSRMGR